MFNRYIYDQSSAKYEQRLLLIDPDNLFDQHGCASYFAEKGFEVIHYTDDLRFRVEHDAAMHDNDGRYVIVVRPDVYIPYDVLKRFHRVDISLNKLFPKLNASVLREDPGIDLDLLVLAYERSKFDDRTDYAKTVRFKEEQVYDRRNMERYLSERIAQLKTAVAEAKTYRDWFTIAEEKAFIDVTAIQREVSASTDFVDQPFADFILKSFGKLSAQPDAKSPVLVSRAMEYMHDHSDKFAIIVMDGMSQFDWQILSTGFAGMKYEKSNAYAMIPTTTSISRQCLLSNKFPSQLISPWTQSKEKKEFTDCALDLGYQPAQIGYERGYDADFGMSARCAAVIINDVDDMVHGQKQGRIGMFNDITLMSHQDKLPELTKRLLHAGFDVYITADHGNTACTGKGKLVGTGVDVETKSRRMIVLKDFADKDALIAKYDLIDYPKYYLNKSYDYLICRAGESFDSKGEDVMSHGGITIDEVIVPFIKFKAGENNG